MLGLPFPVLQTHPTAPFKWENPTEKSFSRDFLKKKKSLQHQCGHSMEKLFPLFQGTTAKNPGMGIIPTESSLVSLEPFLDFLLPPQILSLLLYFPIPNSRLSKESFLSYPPENPGKANRRSCPCLWQIPELLRSFSLDFEIFPNRFWLCHLPEREKTTPGKHNSQEFST